MWPSPCTSGVGKVKKKCSVGAVLINRYRIDSIITSVVPLTKQHR